MAFVEETECTQIPQFDQGPAPKAMSSFWKANAGLSVFLFTLQHYDAS